MIEQNYFLGSVGRVDAFRNVNGTETLAFVSKTMTDTGINISVTADDIRAGTGAPIVARFFHDASGEVTLTDVMFKRAYVQAQLGVEFMQDGEAYYSDAGTDGQGISPDSASAATVNYDPVQVGIGCGNTQALVWYAPVGSTEWRLAEGVTGKIVAGEFDTLKKYCFRYLRGGLNAYTAKIYADIVPQELHLIVTIPLFFGDACNKGNSRYAGEVQFDFPRFMLNGGQDFAAAMSSNQTSNLSGVLMASEGACGAGSIFGTMHVVYESEKPWMNYKNLEILDESLVVGKRPIVYGIDAEGAATRISNDLLTFKLSDGENPKQPTATDALTAAGVLVTGANTNGIFVGFTEVVNNATVWHLKEHFDVDAAQA